MAYQLNEIRNPSLGGIQKKEKSQTSSKKSVIIAQQQIFTQN